MKKLLKAIVLGTFILSFNMSVSAAADRAGPAEATAMVEKTVGHMKENGKEKAFAAFCNLSNMQFHDRDLYVFLYDKNGNSASRENNSQMAGKNLLDMRDADGTMTIRSFIDVAKSTGKGWIDYKRPNPVTKAIESKSGYIETSRRPDRRFRYLQAMA
jgi:cytochrome c